MESAGSIPIITTKFRHLSLKTLLDDLGILFFVLSFLFLGYKLITFQDYDSIQTQWRAMPYTQGWWITGVLILLPLNWYLEALKWKMLTSGIQKISVKDAVKAVLSGISTGFFTPNRIGELVGRVSFLNADNYKSGITLSIVNSLTQNIVMALFGVPACILFFLVFKGKLQPDMIHFVLIMILCILAFGFLYFTLPHWNLLLKRNRFSGKIKPFTDCLSTYNLNDLLRIIGVSIVRYVVFSLQFYLMLLFFGVALSPWQALLAIPTTYLFVTFTPSLAFSEAAVRSSYAVLIIGAFSGQDINIALAGICIWAVNFVIPMFLGSVILVRKKLLSSLDCVCNKR